jgi:histidine triad (HIT) family protein
MTQTCVFCRIAARTIPAHIVCETEMLLAFLDIAPIQPGHVQIIPKQHYAYFDDLPQVVLTDMSSLAQRLAKAIKRLYGVQRVAYAFTGGDVPHAHAHVVPLHRHDDLTSRRYIAEEVVTYRSPPTPAADEMAMTAESLRAALGG